MATADLAGATTIEVASYGKHLLHRFDNGLTLHSHLRMDGSWRVLQAADPIPTSQDARAILGTDAYTAVGWLLGMLDLVETTRESALIGHLGPDLLSPTWDRSSAALAASNLSHTDGTLGAALLDQTNLAGLGTIWASEALFAVRIHPLSQPDAVPPRALDALVARGRLMLAASARDSEPGRPGHGHIPMAVYGRLHQPCRRCGVPIEAVTVGPPTRQRRLFCCPRCQARS